MRLLDICCGAGGAAMGYRRSGVTDITGVDIAPQPNYPFTFIQADGLEYLAEHHHEYDAFHVSPPCQGYSIMRNLPWLRDREYPHLILPFIEMLEGIGKPYVLENVMGARHGSKTLVKRGLETHGLKAGWLCGMMFQKPYYRHRLFAANWLWLAPMHPKHVLNLHPRSERYIYGGEIKGLPRVAAGLDVKPRVTRGPSPQKKGCNVSEQIVNIPTKSGNFIPRYDRKGTGLNYRKGYEHVPFSVPTVVPMPVGHNLTPGQRGIHSKADVGKPKNKGIKDWEQRSLETGHGILGGNVGTTAGWKRAAAVMEIDWMKRQELTQAVPPIFTEHIGRQLLELFRA